MLPHIPVLEASVPRRFKNAPRARSLNRKTPSRRPVNAKLTDPPHDLASLIRGMYGRVARKLGLHPSYVSRVARSERRSKAVEDALRRELNEIVGSIGRRQAKARRAQKA